MPELVITNTTDERTQTANTIKKKCDVLRDQFFPAPRQADLTDILEQPRVKPLETEQEIPIEEINEALRWIAKNKAPGPDQIPNQVLFEAREWLSPQLKTVFSAALRNGYHPYKWKQAITMVLRKPNKADYSKPSSYRPIALLAQFQLGIE